MDPSHSGSPSPKASPATRPTLFIAHTKELIRSGLVAMASDHGMRVTGCVADTDAAVEGIVRTRPAVALVDCLLAGTGGFDAARRVAVDAPQVRVILMSVNSDANHLARAHAAGAVNCIAKGLPVEEVARAIEVAAAGERLPPGDPFAKIARTLSSRESLASDPRLSPRERQVLRHLAYGLENDEIAASLAIGVETVKTHVHKLLQKMNLRDRTQAAVWAVKNGIA